MLNLQANVAYLTGLIILLFWLFICYRILPVGPHLYTGVITGVAFVLTKTGAAICIDIALGYRPVDVFFSHGIRAVFNHYSSFVIKIIVMLNALEPVTVFRQVLCLVGVTPLIGLTTKG